MTDREILELAARAMLYDDAEWDHERQSISTAKLTGSRRLWNPITDDGDALRLAVKMNITVHPGFVYTPTGRLIDYRDYANIIGATRLAIVRAAAEIGRDME